MNIEELWRYPVKSTQGEALDRAVVTNVGLEWDRQIAVVDAASGRPLTARREPRLLLLSAAMDCEGLRITTPENVVLASDEELTAWLGRGVRLARPPIHRQPEYEYPVDPEDEAAAWNTWKGPTHVWHDSTRTQVSLLSARALSDWPVRRFRPNVLLHGVDEAGLIDLVGHRVALGGVILDVAKRIDRCVMVTRAQPNLERDLGVLRAINRDFGGYFGVGARVVRSGVIARGDELHDLGRPTAGAEHGIRIGDPQLRT